MKYLFWQIELSNGSKVPKPQNLSVIDEFIDIYIHRITRCKENIKINNSLRFILHSVKFVLFKSSIRLPLTCPPIAWIRSKNKKQKLVDKKCKISIKFRNLIERKLNFDQVCKTNNRSLNFLHIFQKILSLLKNYVKENFKNGLVTCIGTKPFYLTAEL